MPEKWKVGIMCPIFKKGDKMDCKNYRGITLLNVSYKILSSILNARITDKTEKVIGEYQCGFRPGRGTTDQIFVLQQMMEKYFEHDIDLHFLFVDFKEAFPSVNRKELVRAMVELGISRKLCRLAVMTFKDTRASVKVGSRFSDCFDFVTGVRQGDGLAATLFNIALHAVVKEIDPTGTIFYKSSQVCAYADDIVIVARSVGELKEKYRMLEKEAEPMGLIVNADKTKYMVMSTSEERRRPRELQVGNKSFEGVSIFKYLGVTISAGNSNNDKINERIQAGNRAYFANLKLLKSRLVSREAKMKLYRTLVRPVVTYGCETWTMTVANENALRRFERRILRRILGPVFDQEGWRIRRNEEILTICKGEDVVRFVKSQRVRWLGHVQRMDEERSQKKMMKGRLFNRRKKGRPRSRWLDNVEEDLRKVGVRGWRERAANRAEWRKIVKEAKTDNRL